MLAAWRRQRAGRRDAHPRSIEDVRARVAVLGVLTIETMPGRAAAAVADPARCRLKKQDHCANAYSFSL